MPATPPLPIVNQPEFPHGLLADCVETRVDGILLGRV
jgi:hypothetical protein